MKLAKLVLVAVLAFAVVLPTSSGAQTSTPRGVIGTVADATAVADGTFDVYIDLRYYTRTDVRVVQSGGSGTISFTAHVSWESGGDYFTPAIGLNYDDVGLEFYGSATFTDATEHLLDNAGIFLNASWMKLTFTVSGASSDASYSVIAGKTVPGA